MAFETRWNKWYEENPTSKPVYDNWLDKYSDVIKNIKTKMLDILFTCLIQLHDAPIANIAA